MQVKISAKRGQSFTEFILLLSVLAFLSFTLLKGINGGTGVRWQVLVGLITSPNIDKPVKPPLR